MATQTAKSNEQTQASQGTKASQGAIVRGSQGQVTSPRRGAYALGFPLSPMDFFRMNPFSMMRAMTEELDRTFNESNSRERAWAPAIEVTQREGNFVVRAELPGLNADDVKLEITDDAIVIEGERKAEHEETKGGIHVTERRYGRFYRAIPLPEGAKTDGARAVYTNGVLEVTVPAEEPKSQRREIPIQGGTSSSASESGSSAPTSQGSSSGSSDKAA